MEIFAHFKNLEMLRKLAPRYGNAPSDDGASDAVSLPSAQFQIGFQPLLLLFL